MTNPNLTFKKIELLLFYGGAYLITAILITILFLFIQGDYSTRNIILSFSMWGIIWLISMFAFPLFLSNEADNGSLPHNPKLALFAYLIIIVVFAITYFLHKNSIEKRTGEKVTISKIVNLYFPPPPPKKKEKSSKINKTTDELSNELG